MPAVSSGEGAVDVVIPTRNRPQLLQHAVRSVVRQTHADLSVWVIDDAGSEGPVWLDPDLARDGRVQLMREPLPLTGGGGRNAGLALGSAPYVAFLDDDDEWMPEVLEVLVRELAGSGPEVGFVSCGDEMWADGRLMRRHLPAWNGSLERALLERPLFCSSATLIRRSAIEAIGGFDPSLERRQDWCLYLELASRFEARVVPRYLVRRRHAGHPPERELEWLRELPPALRDRIAALPRSEAAHVSAGHHFDVGVLLARCGRRTEARSQLLEAWRLDRRRLRPLIHLARTVTSERAWTRVSRRLAERRARRAGGPSLPPPTPT